MSKHNSKAPRKTTKTKAEEFVIINHNACGIDVGATSIFVAVPRGRDPEPTREFETFTEDYHKLARWLKECRVTSIAMESTGVYWTVLFEVLLSYDFDVKLVNARQTKGCPGRLKTDVSDAEWIQRIHSYGLLTHSFIPADNVLEFRTYVRQRIALFQHGADHLNRVQKALELMNIKLPEVISDVAGVTGTKIIEAILAGERSPEKLASHRDPRCKKPLKTIAKALSGNWRLEHLFSLKQAWEAYHFFHNQVLDCEKQIQQLLDSFQKKLIAVPPPHSSQENTKSPSKRRSKKSYNRSPYIFDMRTYLHEWAGVDLCAIPGINENIAARLLSEIGTDMSKWRSSKHFASWLGLCPNNKKSGGRVLSSATRPGNNRANEALRMAANSLYRADCYLGAHFRKCRGRHNGPKAITMVAHKLARLIYRMLKEGKEYVELGASHHEAIHREREEANIRRRAKDMGFDLVPMAAA